MTSMEMDEFSKLASSSMPTLEVENISWNNRSLNELKMASESLLGGPYGGPPLPVAGQPNSDHLTQLAASTKEEPKPKKFLSVEELLQNHQQEILERIHRREYESTQRKSQDLLEKQLHEEWEKEKQLWMKELVGSRTLGGSAAAPGSAKTPLALTDGSSRHMALPDSSSSSPSARPDSQMIKSHVEIVKRINRKDSTLDIAASFQNAASPSSTAPTPYGAAWKLLFEMIASPTSNVEVARGALIHFSNQFRTLVFSLVRSASLAGEGVQQTFGHGLANAITSFVRSQLGSDASIWVLLYYCLRCGDAVAASEVLGTAGATNDGEIEASVRSIIAALSHHQGSASCYWEKGATHQVSLQDRQGVADLLQRAKSQDAPSLHKIGVLALLSGAEQLPSSEKIPGFNLIEDYLFGALAKAVQQSDAEKELIALGEYIQNLGFNYFGNDSTNGWSYAFPLLVTQQYYSALEHLARAGGPTGLFQATHIAIALGLANIPVQDLGKSAPQECFLTSLLAAYSSIVLTEPGIGALGALEYLSRIPIRTSARKEIAKMVVKSNDFDGLAGILSEDGRRGNGALDEHLSAVETSSVLVDAAEMFKKDGNYGNAGRLFMLAGRFDLVLVLLNQLISPPDRQDESQRYWYREVETFHKSFLATRTHVLEVLERDGKRDLITTSKTLMQLILFFDRIAARNFEDAVAMIDGLQLLPLSENDVAAKTSHFNELDPLVKDCFPKILRGVNESLFFLYRQLKDTPHGQTTSTVQQRLKEIKARSSLLITFAGTLPQLSGADSETMLSMARLQGRMI